MPHAISFISYHFSRDNFATFFVKLVALHLSKQLRSSDGVMEIESKILAAKTLLLHFYLLCRGRSLPKLYIGYIHYKGKAFGMAVTTA